MKPDRVVGIAGFGGYVPTHRIATRDILMVWPSSRGAAGVEEKAVCGLDEDVATMCIEAGYEAMSRALLEPGVVGACWVGSESAPYGAKPCAVIVGEALGVTPNVIAADVQFACKSGSEAMQAAIGFVGSRMVDAALAMGADAAQSRPGDALEVTAGCGAAAFVFADGERSVALVEGCASYVTDCSDFYRRQGARYPQHAGRFTGEPGYFAHIKGAVGRLLLDMGATPRDFSHVVFHQPLPRFVEAIAEELGFVRCQYEQGLIARRIGNCYAASSLLGLVAVLDVAQPGQKILLASYGSGAGSDAIAFSVTDRIVERQRIGLSLAWHLARRRVLKGYGQYARLSGKVMR